MVVRLDQHHTGSVLVVPPFECAWLFSQDFRLPKPSQGLVIFEAKGNNDVTIIFKHLPGSKREQYMEPNYTVILGSHKNSRVCIDKNGATLHMAGGAEVPGAILDASQFQKYWVDLNRGVITIGVGEPGCHPYHRWQDPCPEEGMEFVGLSTWDKHICYRNVAVRPALHLPSAPDGTVHGPTSAGAGCWFDPPGVGWFRGRKEMSDVALLVRAEARSALPRKGPAPPAHRGEVARGTSPDFNFSRWPAPSVGSIELSLSASTLDSARGDDSALIRKTAASAHPASAARTIPSANSSSAVGPHPCRDADKLWKRGRSGLEAAVNNEQDRWERVPAHRLVLARWCYRFGAGGDAGGEGACGGASEVKLVGVRRQELELLLYHCYGGGSAGLPNTKNTMEQVDEESLSNLGNHLGVRLDMMQRLRAAADTSEDSSDTRKGSHLAGGPDVIWCSNARDLDHLSDVQLLVDGCAVQAHALVLSTASLVFFKMFTSGFRESLSRQVKLHDTTTTAVHTMLGFLLTGMLSEDEGGSHQTTAKRMLETLQLAERFALARLARACRCHLSVHITPWSAMWSLLLSQRDLPLDTACHRAFRDEAVQYVAKNLESVLATVPEAWTELLFEMVLTILSHADLVVRGEHSLLQAVWLWVSHDFDSLAHNFNAYGSGSVPSGDHARDAGASGTSSRLDSIDGSGSGKQICLWCTYDEMDKLVSLVRFALLSDADLLSLQGHPMTSCCRSMHAALREALQLSTSLYGSSASAASVDRPAAEDAGLVFGGVHPLHVQDGWKVITKHLCHLSEEEMHPRAPGTDGPSCAPYRLSGVNLQQRASLHKELIYLSDNDMNGVLYCIGTAYGTTSFRNPAVTKKVLITASSPVSRFTDPKRLASRIYNHCSYASPRPEEGKMVSWWCVDLGQTRRLFCNYYTLQHDSSDCYLRCWELQGSQNGQQWATLRHHNQDFTINSPGQFASWPVHTRAAQIPFRYFRLLLHGSSDQDMSNLRLCVSALELYGTLEYEIADTECLVSDE